VGKYGTNLEGFGAFEGGVNADKGAPLVSTSSDGETALLFGPAALREIQTSVANGDFAIPPDEADATITAENPLPYWTFTDVNSAGAITCAIVTDANTGSTNVLRWTVNSGTLTGKSATLTRYVPVSSTLSRSFSYYLEASFTSATNSAQSEVKVSGAFYKTDLTISTGAFDSGQVPFSSLTSTTGVTAPANFDSGSLLSTTAPSDAAFLLLTITISTVATQSAARTIDLAEVNLYHGAPEILLTDRSAPQTHQPAVLQADGGELLIQASAGNSLLISATKTLFNNPVTTTSDIGFDGVIYGTSALTGPNINLGGTNARLWTVSASAADLAASTTGSVAGILITKSTAGQPTTTVNGTGTTDAFADALRNGGIASDNTNGRFYVYNGGAWKFAALTTPSDSRLKEEITEITGALDTLRQLMPVAFKWKRPEAHPRTDAVADDGKRLGFIADQVATTDLKGWVEDMGVSELESDLIDTDGRVLAVNIPQNEMEALVVQALLDIDTRLKALESR
jgi:hypothetical protein